MDVGKGLRSFVGTRLRMSVSNVLRAGVGLCSESRSIGLLGRAQVRGDATVRSMTTCLRIQSHQRNGVELFRGTGC